MPRSQCLVAHRDDGVALLMAMNDDSLDDAQHKRYIERALVTLLTGNDPLRVWRTTPVRAPFFLTNPSPTESTDAIFTAETDR